MTETTDAASPQRNSLILPFLAPVYSSLHDLAFTLLRVVAGGTLITHGAGKIVDPFGAVGMVESLGFYPGIFWSPLLAATEFFGGIMIVLGLFTRAAAFAAMIVLLVTVWFHWVTRGEGYQGAEQSIIWAAIFAFLAVRGGGAQSVDARLAKTF